ncbi:DUF3306 domain-containing protein [Gemmobacter nectariphilus]|uniref:DUF3306 domain-containing protein n=1 Tax=Gemmobacter nectariphilus TaxID=220343 RepID=UPI00040E14D2|nr:DUF3306 domain-containing protein [Gemmobacter nectariphilus]
MSGFVRRWSDRKAEARKPAEAEPAATDEAPESPAAPDEAEIAARIAALPALDDIGATTDIRPFLQDFVPAALRKAAMRRAWAADPLIASHLDVARDYAWDFNTGAGPDGFYAALGKDAVERGLAALDGLTRQPVQAPTLAAAEDPGALPPADPPDDETHSKTEAVAPPPDHPPTVASPLLLPRRHGGALPR